MLVETSGHHLHTVELGTGTPLVLHSGWVASWELWLPSIEVLQSSWRCVAYDHRGSGASTFPPTAIAADALVDDVFAVMDAHGLDRCVLAGESLGSIVCQLAVLRDPSRFTGLVMVGGYPRVIAPDDDALAGMRADWPGYVTGFVDACIPEPNAKEWLRFGCNTLLPAGPEAAVAMLTALSGVAPDTASIGIPSLVVHGAHDVIAPPDGARELAAAIPDAELVVLDDAGHVPVVTRPQRVAAALNDWWARTGS